MDVPSGTSLNKLDLSVDTKAAAVPVLKKTVR